MPYKPTIGLEIHVELKTKTKMFCDSLNDPLETHPNINICPICAGHPGSLPVINKEAIKKVILAGKTLNCQIADDTFFERKNYFYPDLPKGYQISQYQKPLCFDGELELSDGKKIKIRRIHIEEDTGKLFHSADGKESYVDFNRAGIPLMELVTEPDFESGEEVREFAQELQLIFRYLNISDADMEKGQMRIEVNISVSPSTGSGQMTSSFGTKVEIKNLNSIRAAANSVDYEIKRQTEKLDKGEKIIQETRGWDDNKKQTFSQRTKEESHDYRYFPEPDLPPLKISGIPEFSEISVPELPRQRKERFKQEYGLPEKDIEIFVTNKPLGDYFEKVVSEIKAIEDYPQLTKLAANYLITELTKLLHERTINITDSKIEPEMFAEFLALIHRGAISSSGAQVLLKEMLETGLHPEQIIKQRDLTQISRPDELLVAIEKAITQNPKAFEDFKKGKKESLMFLVGQVMKETRGKANPQMTRDLIEKMAKK